MHFFVSSVTGKNKMVRSYNLIYDNFFNFFCSNFYNSFSLHFVTLRLFFVFDVRSSNNFPQNYCSLVTRKVAWDWTVNSYIKTRKKHTLGLQSCCAVQIFYFSYIYVFLHCAYEQFARVAEVYVIKAGIVLCCYGYGCVDNFVSMLQEYLIQSFSVVFFLWFKLYFSLSVETLQSEMEA